jgi:pilus assembly protein CpaB
VKRISPATVTFGVMAIVLGLVAAYIVRQSMHKPVIVRREVPPPVVVDPGVLLVIAKHNLPAHTRLTAEDLDARVVPTKQAPANGPGVSSMAFAAGRILNKPMKAGQIVREEHLLEVGEGLPDLSERLPAGYRAVTIDVEGAQTGGKRLSEGDLVDISLTVEGTHPDLGEVSTRTLLRGVQVVDAFANRPIVRGAMNPRDTGAEELTVAVKPSDANKLIVAQRTGILGVSLVSAAEAALPPPAVEDTITRRDLLGLKEIPPPPAPPKKFTVEKWTGNSVTVIEMSNDRVRESRAAPLPSGPLPTQSTQPTSVESSKPDNKTSYIPSGVVAPGVVARAQ